MDVQDANGNVTEKRLTPYPESQRDRRNQVTRKHLTRNDKRKNKKNDESARRGSKTRVMEPIEPIPFVGSEEIEVSVRGFSYNGKGSNWNMTCAGLSSMLLGDRYISSDLPQAAQDRIHESIRDGFGWIMNHWTPTETYYGLYSLEKVADIGGAGAGVKAPFSYGATDELGFKAVENVTTVYDFHATILHLLGIDHETLSYYHNGLERRLTDVHGRVIDDILAV